MLPFSKNRICSISLSAKSSHDLLMFPSLPEVVILVDSSSSHQQQHKAGKNWLKPRKQRDYRRDDEESSSSSLSSPESTRDATEELTELPFFARTGLSSPIGSYDRLLRTPNSNASGRPPFLSLASPKSHTEYNHRGTVPVLSLKPALRPRFRPPRRRMVLDESAAGRPSFSSSMKGIVISPEALVATLKTP